VILLFQNSDNFAREYKYTIGQQMKDEGALLIKNIYRANKAIDKSTAIWDARENVEMIRLFVRLMQEFNQIGLKKFVEINFSIEEVSKQLSAWEKYNDTKLKSAASLKDGQDENEGDGSGGDGKNGRGGKSKAPPESSVARAQASVRSKSNNPLVKSEESCLTKRHIAQLHQKNRAINSEVIFTGAVAGNRNNAGAEILKSIVIFENFEKVKLANVNLVNLKKPCG
jgi:hypothetical protein